MNHQADMLIADSLLSPNNITNVNPKSEIQSSTTSHNASTNTNNDSNGNDDQIDSTTGATPHNTDNNSAINSPNNDIHQNLENFNLDNFEIWNNFTVLHDLNQFIDNSNTNGNHNNTNNNGNNLHQDGNLPSNEVSHSNYSNSLTDNSTTGLTPITGDLDNDSPHSKNMPQSSNSNNSHTNQVSVHEINGFFNDFDSVLKDHHDDLNGHFPNYQSSDLNQSHSLDKVLNQDLMMDSDVINTKEIFTPLISPAVMPLDKSHHINGNSNHHNSSISGSGNRFSPLSSPALGYMSSRVPTMRTKRLSSQDPTDIMEGGHQNQFSQSSNNGSTNVSPGAPPFAQSTTSTTSMSPSMTNDDQSARRSSYKRTKTPITTPIFGPTNPSVNSTSNNNNTNSGQPQQNNGSTTPSSRPVQSPIIIARHSSYHRRYSKNKNQASQTQNTNASSNVFDMLPESASNFAQGTNNTATNTTNNINNNNNNNPPSSEMMPPPSNTYNPELTNSLNPVTPAALMSKIPLNASPNTSIKSRGNSRPNSVHSTPLLKPTNNVSKDNLLANPNHLVTTKASSIISSSPVILPSSNHTFFNQGAQQFSLDNNSDNGGGNLDISMEDPSGRRRSSVSSFSDKKVNHKLAEQGRRNRMNIAIQDLEKLIPDFLKNEVIVPSKATTVELASKFIIQLQEQLQQLRQSIDDGSSISPLDYTETHNNHNHHNTINHDHINNDSDNKVEDATDASNSLDRNEE